MRAIPYKQAFFALWLRSLALALVLMVLLSFDPKTETENWGLVDKFGAEVPSVLTLVHVIPKSPHLPLLPLTQPKMQKQRQRNGS